METNLTREEAHSILTAYLKNPNLLKHSYATEAAMSALYKRLTPTDHQNETDATKWAITGLLHDADYELSKDHPEVHGLLLFQKVPSKIPPSVAHAIKSHNYEYTKVMPENILDWSIACCDQLTGLIVACALVIPDKKLATLTPEFVLKKINNNSFAKGATRKSMLLSEEKLRIPLPEFVEIVLKAMQGVSDSLGL